MPVTMIDWKYRHFYRLVVNYANEWSATRQNGLRHGSAIGPVHVDGRGGQRGFA